MKMKEKYYIIYKIELNKCIDRFLAIRKIIYKCMYISQFFINNFIPSLTFLCSLNYKFIDSIDF